MCLKDVLKQYFIKKLKKTKIKKNGRLLKSI